MEVQTGLDVFQHFRNLHASESLPRIGDSSSNGPMQAASFAISYKLTSDRANGRRFDNLGPSDIENRDLMIDAECTSQMPMMCVQSSQQQVHLCNVARARMLANTEKIAGFTYRDSSQVTLAYLSVVFASRASACSPHRRSYGSICNRQRATSFIRFCSRPQSTKHWQLYF